MLRDEMQQVEHLLQAELTVRNDALARARAEGSRLKDRVESLERDLAVERERSDSSEKDLYKERLRAEALVAENKTLRRNSEALATELDALASSVNRHMAHPVKDGGRDHGGHVTMIAWGTRGGVQKEAAVGAASSPAPPPLLSAPSSVHAMSVEGFKASADSRRHAAQVQEGKREGREGREGGWGEGGAVVSPNEASWGSPVVTSMASPL